MTAAAAATFFGRDLDLELLDPGSVPLVRLYRHPGGDWDPPPEVYRNLRVDPPPGRKGDYAVLYTADCVQAVAAECGVLVAGAGDNYTWSKKRADEYKVARYSFSKPALFIPIDGPNRRTLTLSGPQRKFLGYEPYQAVALELFQRFGALVHGLSWESFHRNQPGRVYALWHHHKDTVDLRARTGGAVASLSVDGDWLRFLADNGDIEAVLG